MKQGSLQHTIGLPSLACIEHGPRRGASPASSHQTHCTDCMRKWPSKASAALPASLLIVSPHGAPSTSDPLACAASSWSMAAITCSLGTFLVRPASRSVCKGAFTAAALLAACTAARRRAAAGRTGREVKGVPALLVPQWLGWALMACMSAVVMLKGV